MKSFLTVLLTLSLLGNVILFLSWQAEREDHLQTIQKESEFLDKLSQRMSKIGEKP